MSKEDKWYRQLKFYFEQLLGVGADRAEGNRFIVEALESQHSQYYFRARNFLLELVDRGELTSILVWRKPSGAIEDLPDHLLEFYLQGGQVNLDGIEIPHKQLYVAFEVPEDSPIWGGGVSMK